MISSDHLEPGKTGKISATVDTVGRSGRLEKHITVYSNDRDKPVVTLTLTLDIGHSPDLGDAPRQGAAQ